MRAFSVEKIGLDLLAWLALPHFHRGAKPAWTLAAVRVSSLFRLAAIYVCLLATCAYAAVTVTPATGGTNILADKAANATSPAWTPLGPIIIKEGNKFDFSSGANLTLVLKAPSGFEFNTSAPPNIAFTSGVDISAASVAISNAMTITVTLTVGGTSGADQLTIGNINAIQVRPTAGTPLATGQIFRPQSGGGTAVINGITTSANTNGSGGSNFGSLSESVGVEARLAWPAA